MIEKVKRHDGRWRLYVDRKPGFNYLVIGDSASGIPGRNKSASGVICLETHELCACFSQEVGPEDFKEELEKVGKYYNTAEIIVEYEKYGMVVLHLLRSCYTKIYSHSDDMTGFGTVHTHTLGWNPVVARNRQVAVDLLKVDIGYNISDLDLEREKAIKIYDKETLFECQSFIRNRETGKEEAAPGRFDDLVAVAWIGNFVWHEKMQYYKPPKEEVKQTVEDMLFRRKPSGRTMGGREI